MKKIVFTAIITLSVSMAAAANPGQDIMTDLVNKIESSLDQFVSPNVINTEELASSNLRQHLFKLQSLAEVFQKKYPSINEIYWTSKRFEDQIGGFRQTREQYQFAVAKGAPDDNVAELRETMDRSRETLTQFIQSDGWQDRSAVARTRDILAEVQWDSTSNERAFAYDALANRLSEIDSIEWNMFELEAEFGLHNLRKKIRWYRLDAGLYTEVGLIRVTDGCEIGGRVRNDACEISSCFEDRLTEMYSVLGDIKDEAEGQHGVGGEVPREMLDRANNLYQAAKRDRVFFKLASELSSCGN